MSITLKLIEQSFETTHQLPHTTSQYATKKRQDHHKLKAVANNLEASHSKAEARDLSTININFRTTGFREAHIRAAIINTAATANPIPREVNLMPTEDEAMAGVLNKQEDTVMVGPITRVIIIITSISIILMISRWNSMAHPVAYVVVLIIPLSIATKENMI